MFPSIDNYDDKANQVIGGLLASADPVSKQVISVYDLAKDFQRNVESMGGRRFNAEELDTCAKYLRIELLDGDGSKLYSNKSLVARRIIMEMETLFPTHCMECSEE